jgi:exopolysaccharide production protein ExoZ
MKRSGNDQTFYGIQALRAIAALMVVLVHSIYLWHSRILHEPDAWYWTNGASGVDIFFVISGFVMTISMGGMSKFENPAGVFLWRRITRIVPLYWLATTLKVVLIVAVPAAALHPGLRLSNVVGSYLFIPTLNADGLPLPVIVQGWTLNFEMFFYVVFAGSLLVRHSPTRLLIPVLSVLAIAGIVHPMGNPTILTLISPMLLEFLFGVFLGHWALKKRLPGTFMSGGLIALGFALILTLFPHLPQQAANIQTWRFVVWGLPALAIVLGVVGLEPVLAGRLPKWVIVAGNASYAVYLSQTFVLPVIGIVTSRLPVGPGPALAIIIVLGMSFSFMTGDVIHRFVEVPVLAKLKRINVPGVSTVPRRVEAGR